MERGNTGMLYLNVMLVIGITGSLLRKQKEDQRGSHVTERLFGDIVLH